MAKATRRAWLAGAGASAAAAGFVAPARADPIQLPDPPPGKALVVFYRNLAYAAAALTFMVREGQTDLGELSIGTYFTLVADPGWHTYTVRAERHDNMQIELDADETYYVHFELGTGVLLYQPSLSPAEQWQFLQDSQHGLRQTHLASP